jgi:iron complex outermembrane receptor protein
MEGSKQESIDQLDRPFLGTHDLRDRGFFDQRQGAVPIPALGGAFSGVTPYGSIRDAAGDATPRINILPCGEVNPTTGLCLYDTIPFIQVQPKQERFNVFTRGQFKFTDTLTGYAELGWFHSYTQAIGTPGGVNDAGVFNPGDPLNPVTAPHTTVLPATHPDNSVGVPKTLSLLTTMLGGRNSNVNSDVSRAIVGLKGNITDDWTFDLGGGYLESNLYRSQTGFVRWPVLQAAINNNTFRVNPALDSPALLAAISPTLRDHDKNSLTLADLTVSGKTFNLPGGPLGVAVGLEWRKEKANTPPVPFTDTGEIVGLGFSAFNADRKIYAGYVEVNAPIVSSVEVDAAYRLDHYSDYGRSTTPKIGIKWTPIQQLAFRGTYSEAFRAPGPTESGNSSSLGFTQFAIITTGDPSVKPETAKSYTGGIVFEPFRDTNVSVDYFKIDRKNEITPADQASIVGNLPVTNQVPFSVVPGLQPRSFLYYDFEGNLATISGPFTNLAKTTTDGLEVDARQGFDLADAGKLELRLLWTHVFSFKKTDASGTEFEYVGTHGPYSLSSAGGTPQDRGSLDATWSKESWSMTGRLNYIGAMSMIDHKNIDYGNDGSGVVGTETGVYQNVAPNAINCGVYYPDGHVPNGNCKIPYFITLDLFGKLSVNDHLDVTGSITNATNKHAPFDPYTYGGLNYNPAFNQEGAVGRFFNLGARYRF